MEIKLKKRGKVWAFSFYTPDGERKRLSTGLDARTTPESEALEEAKRLVRKELGASHVTVDKRVVLTLAAALQAHWDSAWSKMRSACTLRYVIPALQRESIGFLPITEVSTKRLREQIRKWQSEDNLSPATINRKLTAISTVLKIHEEDGDIDKCPTIPYLQERNVKERYVTLDEERKALEFMSRKVSDESVDERPKWRLMSAAYTVLVDTGMRLGELVGLTDFNLRRSGGHLESVWLKHGSTKTDKGRVIPLTTRAAAALEGFLSLRAELANVKVDQNWLIRRWQTVRTAIPSLADVNLHILRHTCASRLVEGGLGIYEVSQWLGHTDLKSTMRYAHLAPGRLALGVKALDTVRAQAEAAPHREGTSDT